MSRFTNSLLVRLFVLFFLLSLVPLGILAFLTSRTSRSVEEIAIREGSSALIAEARGYLRDKTIDFARQINLQLDRIESDARVVSIQALEILANKRLFQVAWVDGRYERAANGIFWTPRDYGGSNLLVSNRTPITPEIREIISITERLDPLLKVVCEGNPNASYVFFAGVENLVRGYPWFDAMAAIEGGTLPPDLNFEEEPLFYLAGPGAGGNREAVWSEAYLDVAGRGWMVTCVVPVYQGDRFLGVVGIDVSLNRIQEHVLDVELTGDGYAFLLTGSGNVLASPPEAAEGLGWEVGTTPDRFNLLASSNADLAAISREMVEGEIGISQAKIGGKEVLVSYAPVETARWSLGLVISLDDITQQALTTAGQIKEKTGWLIRHLTLISALLFAAVALATLLTYRRIAGPLNEFVAGALRVGSGELGYRVEVRGSDEIGKLASTFNAMADSLQRRDEELAKIQARLLESEKLSSMGKVSAAVAHEIRNALGTIKNSTYFLRGKIGESDRQLRRYLAIIEEEIEGADHIVSELLDFARGISLQASDVSINALLREVLAVFREKGAGEIVIVEDLDQALPLIRADAVQIRHVLYNVVENAYQAMGGGGTLRVKTEVHDGGIRVAVSDTGPGIRPDEMEKLFEPFYTTKSKGIGLGLSISKRVIERHGGRIRLESELGKGTRVIVDLKARPMESEGEE